MSKRRAASARKLLHAASVAPRGAAEEPKTKCVGGAQGGAESALHPPVDSGVPEPASEDARSQCPRPAAHAHTPASCLRQALHDVSTSASGLPTCSTRHSDGENTSRIRITCSECYEGVGFGSESALRVAVVLLAGARAARHRPRAWPAPATSEARTCSICLISVSL